MCCDNVATMLKEVFMVFKYQDTSSRACLQREKRNETTLTRKSATELPNRKPATTSEQWFRYSDTRFNPVRKAVQSVPRHSTGLASRLDLVLMVLVMYIWRRTDSML